MREAAENSLVVKINRVIAEHYPEGFVDYPEVIRTLVALSVAHQNVLRKLDSDAADRTTVEAVGMRSADMVQEAARAGRKHHGLVLPDRAIAGVPRRHTHRVTAVDETYPAGPNDPALTRPEAKS